jgi:hypothetical protein
MGVEFCITVHLECACLTGRGSASLTRIFLQAWFGGIVSGTGGTQQALQYCLILKEFVGPPTVWSTPE